MVGFLLFMAKELQSYSNINNFLIDNLNVPSGLGNNFEHIFNSAAFQKFV
jgi:hypothetical protein